MSWSCYRVDDAAKFKRFLLGPVRHRHDDDTATTLFEEELLQLATADVDPGYISKFLASDHIDDIEWKIGESLAEAILEADESRQVVWPWNHTRDLRSPNASLPGADLVGFSRDQDGWMFLFGEVKTSSDSACPPNVMHGKKGMAWQLVDAATSIGAHRTLIYWLRLRCSTQETREHYADAMSRLLRSEGKAIHLVGMLLRDTNNPNPNDISGPAKKLASVVCAPGCGEVCAWYFPVPIQQWRNEMRGAQ